MKTKISRGLILGLSLGVLSGWAQVATVSSEGVSENVSVDLSEPAASAPVLLKEAELDTLLGPVALYPDALVALVLPAATEGMDLVMAARWLRGGGKEEDVDKQPWDESVRALARYPDVLKWMDENLSWTQQVGAAFTAQPADVMKAVQRLRGRAKEAGNLEDTPQQKVIVEKEYIRIVPSEPEVIYVPVYDPVVVYRPRAVGWVGPVVTFGPRYYCGPWLRYDCNWLRFNIWVGWWGPTYYSRPAWGYNPPPPPRTVVVRGRSVPPRAHVWSPTPPRTREMRPLRPAATSPRIGTQRPQVSGRVVAPSTQPRPRIERPRTQVPAPAVRANTNRTGGQRVTTPSRSSESSRTGSRGAPQVRSENKKTQSTPARSQPTEARKGSSGGSGNKSPSPAAQPSRGEGGRSSSSGTSGRSERSGYSAPAERGYSQPVSQPSASRSSGGAASRGSGGRARR